MAAPSDVQELRFTVVRGAEPGAAVSFAPDAGSIRIGRSVDNDIVVNDPTVSRTHARVDIRADGFYLADVGSSAGVEKMGFRLGSEPEKLASGDEFKLGATILRFEVVGTGVKAAAASAAPAEPSPLAVRLQGFRLALERIGLRSGRSQVLAALCILVILVLAMWPGPPEIPPQSTKAIAPRYDRVVGFTRGDLAHLDGAAFRLPIQGEGLGLYFTLFTRSGVEIQAGRQVAAKIDREKTWKDFVLLAFPRAIAVGETARIVFDNVAYAPGDELLDFTPELTWGVRRMWTVTVDRAPTTPAAVAKALEPLLEVATHLADEASSRAKLSAAIRPVLLGTMKLTGKNAHLVPVVRKPGEKTVEQLLGEAKTALEGGDPRVGGEILTVALGTVEGELRKDLERYRNAATVAKKQGSTRGERSAYEGVVQSVPDLTDPRNRAARIQLRRLGAGTRK